MALFNRPPELPPTANLDLPPIHMVWHEILCPLCGSNGYQKIYPSLKLDDNWVVLLPHREIHIAVCNNCGLVFENPQISLSESPDYTDRHYYSKRLRAEQHDIYQRDRALLFWNLMCNRLPWEQFKRFVDIGATGALSETIRSRNLEIEANLVEPSSEAIEYCGLIYPKVKCFHGIFDEFTGENGSYDLITFFNSFMMMPAPLSSLSRARSLLNDDGYLVIGHSQLYFETEVWDAGGEERPWVNLTQLIKSVPLIYYSRNTLKLAVESAGFEIVETIIHQYPEWFSERRRQEFIIIAKPKEQTNTALVQHDFRNAKEVEKATKFFTQFANICSENSIEQFIRKCEESTRIYIVHDGDEIYLNWLFAKFESYLCEPVFIIRADHSIYDMKNLMEDDEQNFILLAGDHKIDLDDLHESFSKATVIDCSTHDTNAFYGNWIMSNDGQVVIVRAFCPTHEYGEKIFPFERSKPDNDYLIPLSEFDGWEEFQTGVRKNPLIPDIRNQFFFNLTTAMVNAVKPLDQQRKIIFFTPLHGILSTLPNVSLFNDSIEDFVDKLDRPYTVALIASILSTLAEDQIDHLVAQLKSLKAD